MSTALEQQRLDLLSNGDSDTLYEVVNGVRVELLPMSAREVGLASVLAGYLWQFLRIALTGHVVSEMLFRLRNDPILERRPDVGYVPFDRWPHDEIPETEAWHVVPALAAEVVSKSNTADEVLKKIEEYFAAGVELVWVIYPKQQLIHVYEDLKTIRVLDVNDTLTGGKVLPQFSLKVSDLFAGVRRPR